jgi:hypothetical protein
VNSSPRWTKPGSRKHALLEDLDPTAIGRIGGYADATTFVGHALADLDSRYMDG